MRRQAGCLSGPDPIPMSQSEILGANYFRAYSPLAKRDFEFRNLTAYELWVTQEADPAVIGICAQPLRIDERIRGRKLKRVVDLWTQTLKGEQAWWFAQSRAAKPPSLDRSAIDEWARAHGVVAQIATPADLHAERCLITNWTRILPYLGKNSPHTETIEPDILAFFEQGARRPLGDLLGHLVEHPEPVILTAVFRLLHDGQLHSDLHRRPLSHQSLLWSADG